MTSAENHPIIEMGCQEHPISLKYDQSIIFNLFKCWIEELVGRQRCEWPIIEDIGLTLTLSPHLSPKSVSLGQYHHQWLDRRGTHCQWNGQHHSMAMSHRSSVSIEMSQVREREISFWLQSVFPCLIMMKEMTQSDFSNQLRKRRRKKRKDNREM